jgi:hypothetical protein
MAVTLNQLNAVADALTTSGNLKHLTAHSPTLLTALDEAEGNSAQRTALRPAFLRMVMGHDGNALVAHMNLPAGTMARITAIVQ